MSAPLLLLVGTSPLIFLVHLSPHQPSGVVDALICHHCDNFDNVSRCYNMPWERFSTSYLEMCENRTGKVSVCQTISHDECQATVFKNKYDYVGNGGFTPKIFRFHGCAYVDVDKDIRFQHHRDCYWERFRNGPDLIHNSSGFEIYGRGAIRRTCYCNKDFCNYSNKTDKCSCGPRCDQESRDECETPGYEGEEKEPYTDNCDCPLNRTSSDYDDEDKDALAEEFHRGTLRPPPPMRMMIPCGKNPNKKVFHRLGDYSNRIYRHRYENNAGVGLGASMIWPRVGACVLGAWFVW